MSKVYVYYDVKDPVLDLKDGQKNDDFPDKDTMFKSHDISGVYLQDRPKIDQFHYVDPIEVDFDPTPGQTVYAVLVLYRTTAPRHGLGDRTYGAIELEGVYDSQKASDDVSASIRNSTYPGSSFWDSNFNYLEDVKTERFLIDDVRDEIIKKPLEVR